MDAAPDVVGATACDGDWLSVEGGALAIDGLTLVVPPGALPLEGWVEVCVADVVDAHAAYSVHFEGPALLPLTVALATDSEPSNLALFVPQADGTAARAILAESMDDLIAGPLHFPGMVYAAQDDRVIVPFQPSPTAIDLLFLIDNSCSMLDEQLKLGNRLPILLDPLDALQTSWQLGVITTDNDDPAHQGRLVEVAGERWLDPSSRNRDALLSTVVSVGNRGASVEQGLATTVRALTVHADGYNAGFRRADSSLVVVAITDEDDSSNITPVDASVAVVGTAAEAMGTEDAISRLPSMLHALVFKQGDQQGTRYIETSALTGGRSADLGTADWDLFFRKMVDDVAQRAAPRLPTGAREFGVLGTQPEIWVTAEGMVPARLAPDAVSFDPATGEIYPLVAPPEGGSFWVMYTPLR